MSAFSELFRSRADLQPDGAARMAFDRFMALALYDPALGYYRRDRKRVGRGEGTDFFTASTSGPVFGELICAAVEKLLAENGNDGGGRGGNPADYAFVEIGAEPGGGVLAGVTHPFREARTIRVGEGVAGNPALQGKCVVFSNELFDAQPFRRFVWREGVWRELGVELGADSVELVECEMPLAGSRSDRPGRFDFFGLDAILKKAAGASASTLSAVLHFDLPLAAGDLAREIAARPWSGLFLACDYGKSWRELIESASTGGTARAYHRHRQSNDLLANPGEQDLTCHVCWDWLAEALTENSFAAPRPRVESQEAFFMNHAGAYLAKAFAEDAAKAAAPGSRKRALMQLLHPAHMGQKFQVLVAGKMAGKK